MTGGVLRPTAPETLAKAVADILVVATDDGARQAALSYWHQSRPWVNGVVNAIREVPDGRLRRYGEDLLTTPADPERYWRLREFLTDSAGESRLTGMLFESAWRAECNIRIGYHLGRDYRAGASPVDVADLRQFPEGKTLSDVDRPPVLVVVPFRDSQTTGLRLRNLLACLLALRDQDYPRERYQVTVVEEDTEPRWRDVLEPYCDRYVFARRGGSFNKSWAVNVGVVHTGQHADLVCVLDADVLCDRRFLTRNVARFERPGTGGHLTYRDMFCLDPAASGRAIRSRLHEGLAAVPPGRLRGFLVRRPPGACIWVRAEAFQRIGGMDERYQGWGGEDNDFTFRVDLETPLDMYRDDLLHLHHPSSSQLIDGRGLNDHIPRLSWSAGHGIGRLPGPASPAERSGEAG